MPATFHLIDTKSAWEQYIATRTEANFLQSWNWGEFQQKLGKKVFRVGVFENGVQTGAILAVKETAKRGSYLTIAGGPLINWDALAEEQLAEVFEYLRQLARAEGCLFIRFRPQSVDSPELRSKLQKLKIHLAPMHVTADLTLQLDLTQSEEELMAGMRKNTRYDVRRAEREGITTQFSTDPADIQAFYEQQVALAHKHHFVPFSLEFLKTQFEVFAADNQALLISSFQNGKLLATAFVLFYNREAVYHYGTSTPDNDRLPGSAACQWAAIKEAKQRGCTSYNFWGIAPEAEKNHRFAGVSLFKRGFGGSEVAYLPAHDVSVSPLYWLTYLFERARRSARHL